MAEDFFDLVRNAPEKLNLITPPVMVVLWESGRVGDCLFTKEGIRTGCLLL